MAGAMKMFCIRKNYFPDKKKNLLFLPCNMAAVQSLYTACEVQMCKGTMLDEYLLVLQSRAAMHGLL